MTTINSSLPPAPLFVNEPPTNLDATPTDVTASTTAPHCPLTKSTQAIKPGGTWSLGRHSDWMCYHDEADDGPISSFTTTTSPTVQKHPNESQKNPGETSQKVQMPSQNFMFFVPTTVVEQGPMAPDASSESWYGPTNLGSLLIARERVLEGMAENRKSKPMDTRSN